MLADAVCSMVTEHGSVTPGRDDPAFIALCEEALASLPESAAEWRARVASLLAVHLSLGTRPEEGLKLGREAVAVAREAQDPLVLAHALLSLQYSLGAHDIEERRETIHEALAIAQQMGAVWVTEMAAGRLAGLHLTLGEMDGGAAMASGEPRVQRRAKLEHVEPGTALALLEGDLGIARERNRLTYEPAANFEGAHLYTGVLHVAIELWRGRTHVEGLRGFVTVPTFVGTGAAGFLGFSHVVAGQTDLADVMLSEAQQDGFQAIRWRTSATGTMAYWAEVAFAAGRVGAASEISTELAPLAGHLTENGSAVWCSIDFARALLALTLGEDVTAESLARDAVAASRSRGTPLLLARELLVLALAQRRNGADPSAIEPLIAEAFEIADRTGAELIRNDAARYGLVAEPAL